MSRSFVQLLALGRDKGASDLHCTTTAPPVLRIGGRLADVEGGLLAAEDTQAFLTEITTDPQRKQFQERGEIDFAFSISGKGRFRINAYRQRDVVTIAARIIPEKIVPLPQLGMPEAVTMLARKRRGLVIVTGPTGAGKSTTLASIVDLINNETRANLITLEDPVEYLHTNAGCLINQREVGRDTICFADGLRASLREDPDIILVGEMRDPETIAIALTAAETGHLVLTTLHTSDTAQTIDRIIDVFPARQQQQVRVQLSLTLQGVIAQQLLPAAGGGRVAAVEVLLASPALRNLIREGKTHQIHGVIQTGSKAGMQLMDASIQQLVTSGKVSLETGRAAAFDPDKIIGGKAT